MRGWRVTECPRLSKRLHILVEPHRATARPSRNERKISGSDGTRTRGLLRDRQAFYPAELRPTNLNQLGTNKNIIPFHRRERCWMAPSFLIKTTWIGRSPRVRRFESRTGGSQNATRQRILQILLTDSQ
jgi:hypothetical protein